MLDAGAATPPRACESPWRPLSHCRTQTIRSTVGQPLGNAELTPSRGRCAPTIAIRSSVRVRMSRPEYSRACGVRQLEFCCLLSCSLAFAAGHVLGTPGRKAGLGTPGRVREKQKTIVGKPAAAEGAHASSVTPRGLKQSSLAAVSDALANANGSVAMVPPGKEHANLAGVNTPIRKSACAASSTIYSVDSVLAELGALSLSQALPTAEASSKCDGAEEHAMPMDCPPQSLFSLFAEPSQRVPPPTLLPVTSTVCLDAPSSANVRRCIRARVHARTAQPVAPAES